MNQSVKALKKAIDSLKNPRDFGAIKSSFVPYPSIIPAFAAIKEFVAETKPSNTLDVNQKSENGIGHLFSPIVIVVL